MKKIPLAADILNKIKAQTHYASKDLAKMIELSKFAESDGLKIKRLEKRECRFCFYFRSNGRVAGRAFTHNNCELCRSQMIFSSTATNKICVGCSFKYDLCSYCMAQIDLIPINQNDAKEKRKKQS